MEELEQHLRIAFGLYGIDPIKACLQRIMDEHFYSLRNYYIEAPTKKLLPQAQQQQQKERSTVDVLSFVESPSTSSTPPSETITVKEEEEPIDPSIHTIQINYKGSDDVNNLTKKKIKKVAKIHRTEETHDIEEVPAAAEETPVVLAETENQAVESSSTTKSNRGRWSKEEHREAVNKKRAELEAKGVNPISLITKESLTNWLNQGYSYQKISRETGVNDAQVSALASTYGLRSNVSKMVLFKKLNGKK